MEIKINKWDQIKLESFFMAKEIINKMKRQPSEWEKIIANKTTDKVLISKIYKQLIQFNITKTNSLIKKMGRKPKQTFLQRRHVVQSLISVQFSSVAQSCLTLCDPMNRSTPGLPVHHQLPEFTQTHIYRVRDATQPSHLLSSPSPPALNPSHHQSLFQ